MPGRFNLFQRTMAHWDSLHPYVAVHVTQVDQPLDWARLEDVLQALLRRRGLGPIRVDRRSGRFEYSPPTGRIPVETVSGSDTHPHILAREIESQINRPFDTSGPFVPFRVFVVPTGSGFLLGLAYWHPVADAETVVLFLRDLLAHYRGDAGAESTHPAPALYPSPWVLRRARHWLAAVRKLLAWPAQMRRMRRSFRLPDPRPDDLSNGYRWFSLTPDQFDALRATARAWEVTVNDLWLALLLLGISAVTGAERRLGRRHQLSAGCVVNLRHDLDVVGEAVFGLFLGSFAVSHPVPETATLESLARDLRSQTASIKRNQLYLGASVDLAIARMAQRILSPRRQSRFYTKHHPLCGGITNLNLNRLDSLGGTPPFSDYLRGVSTGPATPLVLSVTTVGERMNVGISFRPSVFPPDRIDAFERALRAALPSTTPPH